MLLYNYKVNGKDAFKEFYEKNMFLYAFNVENSVEYDTVEEIPPEYGVYSKTFYRKKTDVGKVKVNEK